MKKDKKTAITIGILILGAYGVLVSLFTEFLPLILLFEIMSGAAVITIPLLVIPYAESEKKGVKAAYLTGKIIEGVLMIIAGFLILSESTLFLLIREMIFLYHAYFFIASSMLLYYILYRSELLPRFISVWGFTALALLLTGNLLGLAGFTHPFIQLCYPLIVLNEVFMAIWLIVKGFNISVKLPDRKRVPV